MDIHKPKAPHSWGEFAREIAVVVCGILIALGMEEALRVLHDVNVANDARRNVRAEASLDLGLIRARQTEEGCIDRRLDELAALLARAKDGALDPRPGWVGRPGTAPMFTERWQSATASGRTSLFEPKEQDSFGALYGLFARINAHEAREQTLWSHLRMLETWEGPLGPAARLALAQALEEARYEAWDLKYSSAIAEQQGASLHLTPTVIPDDAPVCVAMDTPRAEAVRRIHGRLGEP
jgi:hypothetical protein